MNPEFRRNVWLELTPLRLIILVAGLMLAFFAAAVTEGVDGPGTVARWLYYFLVVFWGTRNAARSVVGEIRDRTWDSQRLSSLSASTMLWGKLFGATIFNWVGGAICLSVILAETANRSGGEAALANLVYLVALGVISQATSLLASLIAAGRRQGRTQYEVFLYQIAGIAAGSIVGYIADPTGASYALLTQADAIVWWGHDMPAQLFLLASLAIFAGWILLATYRLMRLELKLKNGPLVWLAFQTFVIVYAGGFGSWAGSSLPPTAILARHLLVATAASAVLAYAMVLLEPKDRVYFRWLGSAFAQGQVGLALARFRCWMMAAVAALVLGVALIVVLGTAWQGGPAGQAMVAAGLGFLVRDLGLVVLLNMVARRRGGDLLAIALLVLLYGLLPPIIGGLDYGMGRALLLPQETSPVWLSPSAAWIEAVMVWVIAVAKIALPEPRTAD